MVCQFWNSGFTISVSRFSGCFVSIVPFLAHVSSSCHFDLPLFAQTCWLGQSHSEHTRLHCALQMLHEVKKIVAVRYTVYSINGKKRSKCTTCLQLGHRPRVFGGPRGHTLPLHIIPEPTLSWTFAFYLGEPEHNNGTPWKV